MHIIAQAFGFTRDFLKEWNNSAYFRLKKIPCEFKEQARARHPGGKFGLAAHAFGFGIVQRAETGFGWNVIACYIYGEAT